ncbi:hypothetical protein R5N98_03080 [Tenacibaculum maritimum]|uniref:hypothetical protein n=1 Tax=Tenacibaculum maritimum TaxID=107401 RepID=UPI0012E503BB|nr:hypothetical protein [Tenacibaculum maritimum]CAA0157432.1 conserved hypothetical protein [Tenacibaculum maritimum]CAA0196491.1 conserved hypothetical protein [Tenacibaculum maritimum]
MKQEEQSLFNFSDEISKENNYKLLYPDYEEGRVIIALYENLKSKKYENNQFSEKEIHSLFELNRTASEKKIRYPRTIYKDKIRRLLKFFLKYDEESQLYSFQEYAFSFCSISEVSLKGNFNPTEIEVICSDLKLSLQNVINNEKKLLQWFEVSLDTPKYKLRQQTDFLFRQIDIAVDKIRKDALVKNTNPLKLLETVRQDLIDIQKKNKKLRLAFDETNRIEAILNKIETDNIDITNHIELTLNFFYNIQVRLRNTDRRLDRIKPKINQLFINLNQSEYHAKVELFITLLLNHSEVEYVGSSKTIKFPENLSSYSYKTDTTKYPYLYRDKKLFPTARKARKRYPIDEKIQKKNREHLEGSINKLNKVELWIEQLSLQLQREGTLDVSLAFFQVLRKESNFEIAAKTVYGIVQKSHLNKNLSVEIDKDDIVSHSESNNKIWRTIIKTV